MPKVCPFRYLSPPNAHVIAQQGVDGMAGAQPLGAGAREALAVSGLGEAGTWQPALEPGLPSLSWGIAKKSLNSHYKCEILCKIELPSSDLLYSKPFLLFRGLVKSAKGKPLPDPILASQPGANCLLKKIKNKKKSGCFAYFTP